MSAYRSPAVAPFGNASSRRESSSAVNSMSAAAAFSTAAGQLEGGDA